MKTDSSKLISSNLPVLIEEKDGDYTATVLGWDESKTSGATRAEALTNLRQLLTARIEKAELVSLDIELPKSEHPWMKFAGMFKDDPQFDEMLEEIKVLRRERDAQMEEYYRQLDAKDEAK